MISEFLKQILSARYGKDVRQSIHDSIKELNEVAVTAQGSATVNAQTAITKANEALKASQEAIESAKQAKAYADNAQAVAGVTVATQDTAGLVKGGENHIGLDGTLELVVKTTEASMPNSRKGGLGIDEIGGVSKQDAVPTPDVPQEIKKSVVSKIWTHGKNFLNNTITSTTYKNITYTVNADKSITMNGEATERVDRTLGTAFLKKGVTYKVKGMEGASTTTFAIWNNASGSIYSNTKSFSVEEDGEYDFKLIVFAGAKVSNATIQPMIYEASIAGDTYEPYTESAITLSQPIELYGIGDAQDVIEGGKNKKRIERVTVNALSNWDSNYLYGRTYLEDGIVANTGWSSLYKNAISNMFAKDNSVNSMRSDKTLDGFALMSTDTKACGLLIRISGIEQTLEAYNAFLAKTPFEVVFERATEKVTDLPLADQIALNSLATFDGATHIEFDSEVQPTFKGKYGTSLVGGIALEAYNKAHTHSRTVLWTNSDKTQPIEASTVLLPLSLEAYEQYEFYLITYCDSTATSNSAKQVLMARAEGFGNGNNVRLEAVIKEGDTYHQHERTLAYSYDSNAFVAAQCTYLDASFKAQTVNDKLIPYQIIGIR